DFDGDGDGDLAILDAGGRVMISWNDRAGAFRAPEPVAAIEAVALSFGDLFSEGRLGLVAADSAGEVKQAAFDPIERKWEVRELVSWSGMPQAMSEGRERAGIHLADLDNNGAVDVVLSAGMA